MTRYWIFFFCNCTPVLFSFFHEHSNIPWALFSTRESDVTYSFFPVFFPFPIHQSRTIESLQHVLTLSVFFSSFIMTFNFHLPHRLLLQIVWGQKKRSMRISTEKNGLQRKGVREKQKERERNIRRKSKWENERSTERKKKQSKSEKRANGRVIE